LALVIFLLAAGESGTLSARTRPEDRPLEHAKALVERAEKPRPAWAV